MITSWEIVSDDINNEGLAPDGVTVIEATINEVRGESMTAMVNRGKYECYQYRDTDGYSCQLSKPHPLNDVRFPLRPIYLRSFSVLEDKRTPWLFNITLNWTIPERVEGGIDLDKAPPRRGQWSENRQSLFDPNTGQMHQTTAGELIRGIYHNFMFPTLFYSYRMASLPSWFEDAQKGVSNSDNVFLDGKAYGPNELFVVSATAESIRDQQTGGYWRDINLEIGVDPDGWDRQYPNMGHYELRMYAREITKTKGPISTTYGLGETDIEVYPFITKQEHVDNYMEAYRNQSAVKLGNVSVRILCRYEPIVTVIYPAAGDEAKEVEKPVPLDKNGCALRDWSVNLGTPASYTSTGGFSRIPIPLRTKLNDNELIILKRRPQYEAAMSQWGLW